MPKRGRDLDLWRPPVEEYAAFYCEENAWHLARRHLDGGREVVVTIIASGDERFAMWNQRAAGGPNRPILWDYHVIVASRPPGDELAVWDPDSYAPFPCPLRAYAGASFVPDERLPVAYRPRLRAMDGARYVATLSSDRAHMRRRNGSYRQPPPPWPPIASGPPNLFDLIDPRRCPDAWTNVDTWLAALDAPKGRGTVLANSLPAKVQPRGPRVG